MKTAHITKPLRLFSNDDMNLWILDTQQKIELLETRDCQTCFKLRHLFLSTEREAFLVKLGFWCWYNTKFSEEI